MNELASSILAGFQRKVCCRCGVKSYSLKSVSESVASDPLAHLLAVEAWVGEPSSSSRTLLVDLQFWLFTPCELNICRNCAGGDVRRLNSHLVYRLGL